MRTQDLIDKLRCTAGIALDGEWTRLRPEAREMLEAAADELERMRAALREVRHHADDSCGFMVNVRAALGDD